MNNNEYAKIVDARNMVCPMPLLKLKQALNQIESKERIKLLATDQASKRDVVLFSKLAGHQVEFKEQTEDILFSVTKV